MCELGEALRLHSQSNRTVRQTGKGGPGAVATLKLSRFLAYTCCSMRLLVRRMCQLHEGALQHPLLRGGRIHMPLLPVPSTDLGSWNRRTNSVTGQSESTESQNARRRLSPNLLSDLEFLAGPSPKLLPPFTPPLGRQAFTPQRCGSLASPLGTIGDRKGGSGTQDPLEGIGSPGQPKPGPRATWPGWCDRGQAQLLLSLPRLSGAGVHPAGDRHHSLSHRVQKAKKAHALRLRFTKIM